jgi:alpha-tubulin suppressor-like RCC1 family protein
MAYKKNDVNFSSSFVSKEGFFDIYPSLSNIVKTPALWVWGANYQGVLGTNINPSTLSGVSSPVQTIAGGINWKQVSTESNVVCAIKTDGTLWTWGSNIYGEVGDNTITNKSSPAQTIAGGTTWKSVVMHKLAGAAIKADGTLWMWGWNSYGQLGNNTVTHRSSPVQTTAGGTNWKQVTPGYHTLAVKTDNTLWACGYNSSGQLGDNTRTNKSTFVQTVSAGTNWKQASTSYYSSAAIKTDGTLWTWGDNQYGQLGDNTRIPKSSPVQTVAGGTNWKQVSCSDYGVLAIKTDGTLWSWGANFNGSLGDNTTNHASSPVQTVAGGTNWKQVAAGSMHNAAIKTDGTLWMWGSNGNGQLGDGTTISKSSPIQTIVGGTNWKQVSCGDSTTVAIAEDNVFL